jgi:hypothetical protein
MDDKLTIFLVLYFHLCCALPYGVMAGLPALSRKPTALHDELYSERYHNATALIRIPRSDRTGEKN